MKRIALASEDGSGLEGSLSAHFGRCPFYTFVNVDGKKILGFEVVQNPYFPNHQPGVIPQFIHSQKANVMIAGGMGPRAIDFFTQFGIDVATGAQGKVRDVVEAYLRGEIQGIVACEHHGQDHECGGVRKMKIAISSAGKDLNDQIDPRFGRCQYFILVDPETMEFEAFENEGLTASGGAGVQAAQLIAQKGANALITGNLGPNAASALSASGIKVHLVSGGTVREVTEAFKAGKLQETIGATVPSHFGISPSPPLSPKGRGRG